ncbi:hypothetical protein C8R47DRAFT_1226971 [Mycena vitilis]|nr:hypothetical protein C8R47DRAFT_1226971 [Mycena vitilis]
MSLMNPDPSLFLTETPKVEWDSCFNCCAEEPVIEPEVTNRVRRFYAQAQYTYYRSPENPSALSFQEGEMLVIEDYTDTWCWATNSDGITGIAPLNYLKIISEA